MNEFDERGREGEKKEEEIESSFKRKREREGADDDGATIGSGHFTAIVLRVQTTFRKFENKSTPRMRNEMISWS